MPSSIAPSMVSKSEYSPCSWPLVRGSPRSLAQRPLPSMTIATCWGSACARQRRRPGAGRVRGGRRRHRCVAHASGDGASKIGSWCSRRCAERSTSGSERSPRSRCHCRWAATRPLHSRRCGASLASATRQSPAIERDHQLQRGRRRPGRPGRAAVGADRPAGGDRERRVPARACRRPRTRSAPAPSRRWPSPAAGTRRAPACSACSATESARSAPRVSWNSRSDGSCSTGVSRSAVSAIALAAV